MANLTRLAKFSGDFNRQGAAYRRKTTDLQRGATRWMSKGDRHDYTIGTLDVLKACDACVVSEWPQKKNECCDKVEKKSSRGDIGVGWLVPED